MIARQLAASIGNINESRAARYSTIITARWIEHAAPDGKAYKSMPHTG